MNLSNLMTKLYARCPAFLQDLCVTLYGVKLYYERYRGKYKAYFEFYKCRTHKNLSSEKRIQSRKFLKILHYAHKNSPFYREFYKDIDLSQIKSVEDIDKLPILTKELLKSNYDRIFTIKEREGIKFYTGGTTGNPILVLKRKADIQKRMAYLDAYKAEFGFINNKMPSARFFGKNIITYPPKNHVYWRNNYIAKQRLYSTYYLQEENLPYYVKDLNKFKPMAIDGFPSAIYTVAKYIIENKIELTFVPRAVFTTSESLLPLYRETIEKAFHCMVSDQYASNEGAPFIIQCEHGSYHEAIDTGVFEHIETGYGMKLVVTGFDTFGTPLIRYDIGDLIETCDKTTCNCNSHHPVIGGIIGRDSNYLICKSKGRISQSQLSVLISELPKEVTKMQFQQKSLDRIEILVNLNIDTDKEKLKKELLNKLAFYLGRDMIYEIDFNKPIKRSNSGKFQLIINQMEEEVYDKTTH
jgi:phenylacetate-CoA ligase